MTLSLFFENKFLWIWNRRNWFSLHLYRYMCFKMNNFSHLLVPTEHASWSHMFYFRLSKVNSYKTTLKLCVKLVYMIVYDLSSIVTIWTLWTKSVMVSNTFQQHGAYSYPFQQMGHHFSYLIWATIWRMNPLFTSGSVTTCLLNIQPIWHIYFKTTGKKVSFFVN